MAIRSLAHRDPSVASGCNRRVKPANRTAAVRLAAHGPIVRSSAPETHFADCIARLQIGGRLKLLMALSAHKYTREHAAPGRVLPRRCHLSPYTREELPQHS